MSDGKESFPYRLTEADPGESLPVEEPAALVSVPEPASAPAPARHPQAEAGIENPLRLLFWETTCLCNLECIHCRRLDTAAELAGQDLTTEEAQSFIAELPQLGSPILVLSGGEPLLRPDIFEVARFAAQQGLPVALATNGTLIDQDVARRIRESGIRRVSISLDGADAATHDAFRGMPGSFEQALTGFRRVKAEGVSVQVNCTIARHNMRQSEALYQLALSLGADALHLFMLVPVGCGVEIAAEQQVPAEKYEEILNWLYDKSREGRIQVKATCAPHYFRILHQRAKEEGVEVTRETHGMAAMTKGCLAGTGVCFVSHKGEVFPCGYLPVECGNVRRQSLKTIWRNSEVFAWLRQPELLRGKCGVCEYQKVCLGCRARAYAATGDYLAEEPYCIYVPLKMRRASGCAP